MMSKLDGTTQNEVTIEVARVMAGIGFVQENVGKKYERCQIWEKI